jgi:endonuclease III-like uncharacterized protein
MTIRKTLDQMNSDDLDQLYADLDRAHTELRWWAEADSADAAAGSYALRAERAEQERDLLARTIAATSKQTVAQVLADARAALGSTTPAICELPHQTIAEEDACEQQRLAAADETPEPTP